MGHKKTNTNKEHHIKKQNKNIEQNTDPYKNLVNSGASERLAVPASCRTPVMLFIVNDMYIEYSGFHTNGFSQDTHICFTHFAQYFQDIIYWTQPIKTSSFCEKKIILLHHFHKTNNNNNLLARFTIFVWKIRRTRIFLAWPKYFAIK
jgi:hypothetical protein